ncbi:MAG: hypothetical protein ACRCWM_07740 [Sarcina sp.]|uniref:hypothetical protein n=1 Tax=Clostridium sp. TaxID=1506 RepID=UPI003F3E9109
MNRYNSPCNCQGNVEDCKIIQGNSLDVEIFDNDCEVKADIIVTSKNTIRLWGQATDCDGMPVPNVLVKLLKYVNECTCPKFVGISHTISDCYGYYQFDIDRCDIGKFRILFGKAANGPDREVKIPNCPTNCCTPQPPCPPPCPTSCSSRCCR